MKRIRSLRILAHSRAQIDGGKETGRLEFDQTVTDPAGITAWQAVDGGLYYLNGEKKLRMLRGAATK